MIDVLGDGMRAAAGGSVVAYPLVFVGGVVTSVGPCIAPRYIAVAALANATKRPWRVVMAFVCGLAATYVALGVASGAVAALFASSAIVYGLLAAMLAAGGALALLFSPRHRHQDRPIPVSMGGTFLLGVTSASIVSPCCSPFIAGIAGFTVLSGRVPEGCALLATFAAGHALPLFGAAALGTRASALVARVGATESPQIVAGTLLLALAAYYGALL